MTTPRQVPLGRPVDGLEPALARVLQGGTYVSIGLVALGTVLLLVNGGSPLAGGPPLSLSRLLADIIALRPEGLLWLGILVVVATPALRVVAALVGFWRRGERAMAGVALLILAVVAVGVVIGLLSG
jgi:uncharacterized membrane protein